jgi:ubiquinone/menaquinone biosynthesis C-methylase UbiE
MLLTTRPRPSVLGHFSGLPGRRFWLLGGHLARHVATRLRLASRSVSLFLRPAADIRSLDESVRQKYSHPLELEAHRKEALAGPTGLQRQFLGRYLNPGSKILDVGCAAGRISLAASRAGSDVTAVDACPLMAHEAQGLARRQALAARFCAMDARRLAFADAAFDMVLMFGAVVSYIPTHMGRVQALREAYRVLKPDGKLLVETQSRTSRRVYRGFFAALSSAHRVLEWFGHRTAWEVGDRLGVSVSAAQSESLVYFHMYSPDELARDLVEAGFRPVPVDTSLYLIHYVGVKPRPATERSLVSQNLRQ